MNVLETDKKYGMLLHITSLPAKYGIGDMGPEACKFIDFLSQTDQDIWQILPLNYVDGGRGFSPYSSYSAFAGNIMLISPDSLEEIGLVNKSDLEKCIMEECDQVHFSDVEINKSLLLEKAYRNFRKNKPDGITREFEEFCTKEEYWLNDFSLFMLGKHLWNRKPWNEWPANFKNRDQKVLSLLETINADELRKIKFYQYLFHRQWKDLKAYAGKKGIQFFGDIPFYVDYDSSDVWSNPEFFKLNQHAEMEVVAGVPPDYFNENGQRWGMPIFNWKIIGENDYNWWMLRLKKNLEFVDFLRLDHFRAFYNYWEIPADCQNAKEGKWVYGPANHFFKSLKEKFPEMPFVAEDLGDISEGVYDLRDKFNLPGMNVLQFAFGADSDTNSHLPDNHSKNSLAYTGTHDNNTLRGWLNEDLDRDGLQRLLKFSGNHKNEDQLHWWLIRSILHSKSHISVIPVQDYLKLGSEARMNKPATSSGNWAWKLVSGKQLSEMQKNILRLKKVVYP